ncbi:hypothetical protein [Streptomyces sp. NPDC048256]|uniref:hypothetical protein n=1 Tax=Streptomyces sp. NPDC048256 TaxID=3154613 RepID=UPI0033EA21A3
MNTSYLADLIRKGPFSEPLPRPLEVKGIKDVQIADSSPRIDAVAIDLQYIPGEQEYGPTPTPSAHIEVYRNAEDAARQGERRLNALREQYKNSDVRGDSKSFFVYALHEIIAGGVRGFVYVEAYSFPGANAFISLATGTVSSMLRYSDKMTALATGTG